ncbi:YpoC family protein [Rossellomorea sp. NPDC077527]|uniref:YpoC family protein n=1 Tax=Rossellomorea sp. NPDC077527 TaxID=3364510 RepID=UPI0037C664D6
MSETVFNIPTELKDPFFFSDEKIRMHVVEIEPCNPLFAFELLHYNGVKAHSIPWLIQGIWIKDIIGAWKEEENHLKTLFKSRSKDALQSMKKGIGMFYMLLFWSNKQPVNLQGWRSSVEGLSVKPINTVERLSFIMDNPALYHSYIQLAQLFEEQQKQFAKYQALNQSAKK